SLKDIANFLPGALANIADSLIGLSASGNLSATVSGKLQLKLGLDLADPPVVITTTTQGKTTPTAIAEVEHLVVNATGGTYAIWFDANKNGTRDTGEVASGIGYHALPGSLQTTLRTLNTLSTVSVGGIAG